MPFNFDIEKTLKEKLEKLSKKDKSLAIQIKKKIEEIVNSDLETIELHYKNLKYEMSDKKRVHIGKNFVLTFKYFKKESFILFVDFDHRDKIYR
ncbi:MAG: addiction module toxin RelE [archaeon]